MLISFRLLVNANKLFASFLMDFVDLVAGTSVPMVSLVPGANGLARAPSSILPISLQAGLIGIP